MLQLLSLALALLVIVYAFNTYQIFSKRLAAAKQSGFKIVKLPIIPFNRPWLIVQRLVVPHLRKLPTSWTEEWLPFIAGEWVWQDGYAPFQRMGTDSFLAVAPGGTILYTCDPDVIAQITTRRNDFPKPTEIYEAVNIYGPNVVGTEGAVWRHHRKITSPPFTEKNNELVWNESMEQTEAMLAGWFGSANPGLVEDVGSDTMRVTLHVISQAGFGKKMAWPAPQDGSSAQAEAEASSDEIPPGHRLSYKDALTEILDHLLWLIVMPRTWLRNSPLKVHKKAWAAYIDWRLYMEEIFQAKKEEVLLGKSREGLDLMGALVKGAGITAETEQAASAEKTNKAKGQIFSDEEILGNAFIFMLAGHETTATTVQMALLYLACNPSMQIRLQKDLDNIFGGRPSSEWNYEEDLPKLFNAYPGAVMNEVLRLIPPVVNIPKVVRDQAQPVTVEGQRLLVPATTSIVLSVPAVQRHPKHWPSGPISPNTPGISATDERKTFNPDRWLLSSTTKSSNGTSTPEERDEFGGPGGRDTAATMYHPPRGAYLAFSEGARACLGRRFAQVEVLSVLATVFSKYSVELAVDEWASEEEVSKMEVGGEERKRVWKKARQRADELMSKGMESRMTLQMRGGVVKVRAVERGQEGWRGLGY